MSFNKILLAGLLFSLLTCFEVAQAHPDFGPAPVAAMRVENLFDGERITSGVPTQFRITTSADIDAVTVSANGQAIGNAAADRPAKHFQFTYAFSQAGVVALSFVAMRKGISVLTSEMRVLVVAADGPPPETLPVFNAYVLKAVDYLDRNYGLLGYNVNSQNTHEISYYTYGVFKPTGGGLTMCVAGVLEVIMTAFDIYAKETGDHSIYDFLPFSSWSSTTGDTIKAQIWVNPELDSAGTGDAISHFGIGEHVRFQDLQPGGFININRENGSGHSVTFLGFIDSKGNDVARYDDTVVGFRYFGAQGRHIKGLGGLGFRHAFFSKYGCPDVPYQRDCNVQLSDDQHILNVGQILDPKLWRHPGATAEERLRSATPIRPLVFDGLTTDD